MTQGGVPDYYSVYVTDLTVLGGHAALTLDPQTFRPCMSSDQNKYDVHTMTKEDWENREEQIKQDQDSRTMRKREKSKWELRCAAIHICRC